MVGLRFSATRFGTAVEDMVENSISQESYPSLEGFEFEVGLQVDKIERDAGEWLKGAWR